MLSFHEIIKQRRSIRKFLDKDVSQELILEILEAAQWAPSAHNSQCWRFIIIKDEKIKRLLAEEMANAWKADLKKDSKTIEEEKIIERIELFRKAPVLILVCLIMGDLRKFDDLNRQSWERDLAVESIGAAIENMLLTACAKGLGSCWFCAPAFAKETVRKVLRIPIAAEPSALITLGYPAEKPKIPGRKPLGEFCYSNLWGRQLI